MKFENAVKTTAYDDRQLYALMYTATHEEDAYVCHVKGEFCTDLDEFYREISSGMRFPRYFGWNWAAFDECISDLEWLKFSSLLIVIDHSELLFVGENDPEPYMRMLMKYLNMAVEYWTEQGVPIAVYLNRQA